MRGNQTNQEQIEEKGFTYTGIVVSEAEKSKRGVGFTDSRRGGGTVRGGALSGGVGI